MTHAVWLCTDATDSDSFELYMKLEPENVLYVVYSCTPTVLEYICLVVIRIV